MDREIWLFPLILGAVAIAVCAVVFILMWMTRPECEDPHLTARWIADSGWFCIDDGIKREVNR